MTLEELSNILMNGWPDERAMEQIPFGKEMSFLGKSKEHGEHVRKVVKSINALLSHAPITEISDADNQESQADVRRFLDVCDEIQGKDGIFSKSSFGTEHIKQFLRVCAFYHDIGKVIQKDRHPTVGYYHVTLVEHQDKDHKDSKNLESILDRRMYRILCDMIRYHDLFGVVGTGEGSLAVLVDTIPYRLSGIEEQQTILSLLMFLNISDISGTIELKSTKAGTIAGDWQRLSRMLAKSKGSREKFSRRLILSEQTANSAIERIRRLLIERAPKKIKSGLDSPIDIEDILQITLGPQFYEFCSDFALICKLDYALRFIMALEQHAVDNNHTPRQVIEVVVLLITRLVQSYNALTRRADGSRRRIGIQVSGWTRTPEISKSLIKLLFSDLPRGLGWASEEASAWYIE